MTAVQELFDWAAEAADRKVAIWVGEMHHVEAFWGYPQTSVAHGGATVEEAAQAVLDVVRPLTAEQRVQRWCATKGRKAAVMATSHGVWAATFCPEDDDVWANGWEVASPGAGWEKLAEELDR